MLTARERDETIRQWRDEAITPNAVLAKCAAGLALLAGIALAGTLSDEPPESRLQSANARIELKQVQFVDGEQQEIAVQAESATPAQRSAQTPDLRSISD
jgi:hypothetical protein